MKALTTRVGTYVTGDAVADAVLSYALALARVQAVDVVEIPFRLATGAVSHVQLRLGWLVDLDCVSEGGLSERELIDRVVVTDLRARELALHPSGDTSFRTGEMPAVMGGLDEY
jgi:hypothetical protein